MATNRFGYSDDFVLKNGKVGINTTEPQEKLDVVGVVKGQDLKVTGVSSFTTYEGFLEANHTIDENITLTSGTNSSLSGEIIIGTGVTVTIANVGLGTTTVGVGTTTAANGKTTNTIDTDEIVSSGQGGIDSLKVYNTFTVPTGGTEDRPIKVKPGQLYYNVDFKTVEFWDGNNWRQVDNTTRSGRGIFAGGNNGSGEVYNIEYINITTTGNSSNFGTIASSTSRKGGCGSSTRGLLGGGTPASTAIDYLTIASEGNTVSFGSLTVGRYAHTALSSSTRGIWGGGYAIPTGTKDVLDYVEIATTGSAIDFGNLAVPTYGISALSSPTRGIWVGGFTPTPASTRPRTIDFITIASKGDAIDFGNLSVEHHYGAGASNGLRGVFSGGNSPTAHVNTIDYITIASNGNAQDFGDLTISRETTTGGVSNSIRGVFGSGYAGPTAADIKNTIDYITFTTLGNAQDFGDMSNVLTYYGAISDSHGGLGGF